MPRTFKLSSAQLAKSEKPDQDRARACPLPPLQLSPLPFWVREPRGSRPPSSSPIAVTAFISLRPTPLPEAARVGFAAPVLSEHFSLMSEPRWPMDLRKSIFWENAFGIGEWSSLPLRECPPCATDSLRIATPWSSPQQACNPGFKVLPEPSLTTRALSKRTSRLYATSPEHSKKPFKSFRITRLKAWGTSEPILDCFRLSWVFRLPCVASPTGTLHPGSTNALSRRSSRAGST